MLTVKLVHRFGVFRIDVTVTDMLADDGSVLGFDQAVVAGMVRS